MKFYTFEEGGLARIGVEIDQQLVDLNVAQAALLTSKSPSQRSIHGLPADLLSFIRGGSGALAAARELWEFARRRPPVPVGERLTYGFEEVKLLAPIPRPGKILCCGNNYRSHCQENPGAKIPEAPFFCAKMPSTVIGPGAAIIHPKQTQQLDYGVELAVVIGKRFKSLPEEQVMEHVFGYTILHDVSARDVQFKDQQITLGKNFDTFCPLGPCVVTKDELGDLSRVKLRTLLNGQMMQDGSTADWIFPLPRLLSALSQVMTLEPGDLVSTATPAGVGVFRKPSVFLKPGDRVALEIDGIGRLENPVIAEAS